MAARSFRVKVGERWFTVEVEDISTSPVSVTVEGETFQVEVESLPHTGATSRPELPPLLPRAVPQGPLIVEKVVRSPMSAKVIAVRVRPGDQVTRGQEVCVVEAMKMEQSIRAPQDGVVKAVHVTPLQQVATNEPLVELE